jgi:hypothetical protein
MPQNLPLQPGQIGYHHHQSGKNHDTFYDDFNEKVQQLHPASPQTDEKYPSVPRFAGLPSSLVTAAYFFVHLIPRNFRRLASGHF